MRFAVMLMCLFVLTALALSVTRNADAQTLPSPVIYFTYTEYYSQAGKDFVRYHFDVSNKDVYPAELFLESPSLPPCGANTKASRTWIDVYEQNGKRLNGFCAIVSTKDLNNIWFALETTVVPPSWIYVEFTDRQTNTRYKSNLAETTL